MLPLLIAAALAGEQFSAGQLSSRADTLVEVRLVLDERLPESWPNRTYDPTGWGFPGAIVDRAWTSATATVLAGPEVTLDRAHVYSSSSRCWWKAHERGEVRALVFVERGGRQVVGVEVERGRFSDLNPDYDALKGALVRAVAWTDERMAALDASALWQDQRAALLGEAHLRAVARDWLREHGGDSVLDEVWGAPGSDSRIRHEAAAEVPSDSEICR